MVVYEPGGLDEIGGGSMVMVCVDIRDPGNAGTMIRTADAAGLDAVICCEGTVDPTNPKTLRASSGSLFHLPVVWGGTAEDVVRTLKVRDFVTVGAVVRGGSDYVAVDWCRQMGLVFGNESSGLDPAIGDLLDEQVSIPMSGRAESLNVGSAAAVLCFEAQRQRRSGGGAGSRVDPAGTASTMLTMEEPGSRGTR